MMKKRSCLVLALLMLMSLLAGCNPAIPTVSTKPTGDPEQQIYIGSQNIYLECHVGAHFEFRIFSKQKLDIEQISLELPTENKFELYIYEFDNLQRKSPADVWDYQSYPYYLHHTYFGLDWKAYGQLAAENYSAFFQQQKTLAQNFHKMPQADVPVFYVYDVDVLFTQIQEDSVIETMDVIISGQRYHQQVGRIKLYAQPSAAPYPVAMLEMSTGVLKIIREAWHDGQMELTWRFTAETDMTLTDLLFQQEEDVEKVVVSYRNYATGENIAWDRKTPLTIRAGEEVYVSIGFTDYRLRQIHGTYAYDVALVFETDEGTFCSPGMLEVRKEPCLHEVYAYGFDGVDTAPYYQYYYYPILKNKQVT